MQSAFAFANGVTSQPAFNAAMLINTITLPPVVCSPFTHFCLLMRSLPSALFAAVRKIAIRNFNTVRLQCSEDERTKRLLLFKRLHSYAFLQALRYADLKDGFRLIGQVEPPLEGNPYKSQIR